MKRILPTSSTVVGAALWTVIFAASLTANAQSIVQPGAPGQETKVLAAGTRPALGAVVAKDVEFMQGMIHHHAQAVEMVALFDGRTTNKELRLLGARISHSQGEEMNFMRRWLVARGRSTKMVMPSSDDHHAHHHHDDDDMDDMKTTADEMLMPGMLTKAQMTALAKAKGKEFDRLFLEGMIQHHGGALTMVKELFDSAGAGQDADLFNFATDVDSGQRAEIRIMQEMLKKL